MNSYPTHPGSGDRTPPSFGARPEILASWQRSQSLGIDRDRAALPIDDNLDPDARLMRAAAPVLDRLYERFSNVPVTVALADSQARIVHRWGGPAGLKLMDAASLVPGANVDERFMGTSSVSMALSTRAPFVVVGHEHFLHDLKELTCMAAPVRDPVGGTVRGAVNLSVPRALADPTMALILQDATERIGARLLELSSARERELVDSFQRARERGRHAELDLSSGELSALVGPPPSLASQERLILLERAIELISSTEETFLEVPLAGSRVAMLRRRELHHGDAEGAAVEVSFEDIRDKGVPSPAITTALNGHHAQLMSSPSAAEATAPKAAGDPHTVTPADAWLLLVGEPGVGRLAAEARGRLSLLNEAGNRLGTTLDMRRTAEELAEIAVPRFADLVVVDLVDSVLTGEGPPPGQPSSDVALRRAAARADDLIPDASTGSVNEPVHYPAGTPQARCLETGQPVTDSVWATVPAESSAGPAQPVDLLGEGMHSYLGAPLSAHGSILGLAGFYRRGRTKPYEQDDLTLAEELAARAAISVENARHYRREHHASLTLQRSLLPQVLPQVRAVDLASRYLPADAGAGVGGDWFDVIPLSGMRVALVVGDVPGNGLQAAATMGRLRTAVRTLSGLDLLPEEVLAHLDDLVSRATGETADEPDPATGTTCLYAVYDPASRRCTAARAGHPPPAVVTPGGTARLIDLPAGPPLGLGGIQPYESSSVDLPTGSLLLMYTDGLLKEGRGYGDTDARTEELLASLVGAGPQLPDVCDRVTDTLLPNGAHDDVALLLARVHALPEDQVACWELPAEPSAVARARALTRAQLAAWNLPELDFNTGLVVSELVTNAVRYGGPGPVGLRLLRDDSLICEVSDRSNSSPRIRRAATTEEGGRGLFLVAQFTRSWGARYMPQGKTVWAELNSHAQQPVPETDEQALFALFDDRGADG